MCPHQHGGLRGVAACSGPSDGSRRSRAPKSLQFSCFYGNPNTWSGARALLQPAQAGRGENKPRVCVNERGQSGGSARVCRGARPPPGYAHGAPPVQPHVHAAGGTRTHLCPPRARRACSGADTEPGPSQAPQHPKKTTVPPRQPHNRCRMGMGFGANPVPREKMGRGGGCVCRGCLGLGVQGRGRVRSVSWGSPLACRPLLALQASGFPRRVPGGRCTGTPWGQGWGRGPQGHCSCPSTGPSGAPGGGWQQGWGHRGGSAAPHPGGQRWAPPGDPRVPPPGDTQVPCPRLPPGRCPRPLQPQVRGGGTGSPLLPPARGPPRGTGGAAAQGCVLGAFRCFWYLQPPMAARVSPGGGGREVGGGEPEPPAQTGFNKPG